MEIMAATAKKPLGDVKPGDVVDVGTGPTPRALLHAFATLVEPEHLAEVHSTAPWLIAQSGPNAEKTAVQSLLREGFEAWYPTFRHFKPKPLRKIASNMRHKFKNKVDVTHRPLFPSYVLFRRFAGDFDILKLYELKGCVGLCVFEGRQGLPEAASISDLMVEELRLRVANHGLIVQDWKGRFVWKSDDHLDRVSGYTLVKSGILDDPKARNPWPLKGRIAGRLDESTGLSLFIDRGDRIVRIIRSARDAQVVADSTTQRAHCVSSAAI